MHGVYTLSLTFEPRMMWWWVICAPLLALAWIRLRADEKEQEQKREKKRPGFPMEQQDVRPKGDEPRT